MASRASTACAALLAAAFVSHGAAASDHVLCLERGAVSETLASAHGERPSAAGLASNGELLEIYASPRGNWTLVLTRPDGISCVVASGDGWHLEPKREVVDDANG